MTQGYQDVMCKETLQLVLITQHSAVFEPGLRGWWSNGPLEEGHCSIQDFKIMQSNYLNCKYQGSDTANNMYFISPVRLYCIH